MVQGTKEKSTPVQAGTNMTTRSEVADSKGGENIAETQQLDMDSRDAESSPNNNNQEASPPPGSREGKGQQQQPPSPAKKNPWTKNGGTNPSEGQRSNGNKGAGNGSENANNNEASSHKETPVPANPIKIPKDEVR